MTDHIISSHELRDRMAELPPPEKFFMRQHPTLDSYLGGLEGGEIITVAAMPGSGKTSFAVSLTKDLSQHYPCLWFSCEMAPRSFLNMFGLEIPLFYLPDEVKQFNSVAPTLAWLQTMIRKAKAEQKCKIVFLDHLQYLTNLTTDKSVQMVDYVMRFLKNMCVAEDIILFLITHIDKDSSKDEKRPSMASMRGSQMIAGESSTVIIVQRLKSKDKDEYGEHPWSNSTRFYIDKNRRNGTLGYVTMIYDIAEKVFRESDL